MPFSTRLTGHSLLWPLVFCLLQPRVCLASFAGISPEIIGLPIAQIRISGNLKTRSDYIKKWMGINDGDLLEFATLTSARQELRDTGLFSKINFQGERLENGELTLHLILKEKKYWLLLPRINRNADGDVKAGFRLRMYNLQGADRTLTLLAQQEEESNGDDSEQIRFSFKLPLLNKPYDLRWRINRIIENTEVDDFENIETVELFSMGVARDWHIEGFRIPLTVATVLTWETRELDEPYPEAIEAREAGSFNRLKLELIFDDVHAETYRRYGSYYAFAYARGFDWLGSDYESNLLQFELLRFKRLNRYDNLNYRVVLAVVDQGPFDYLAYSIGGGSTIRGLESVDDRGNARLFANLEYVFAYRKRPNLRHSLFVDIGNVYDQLDEVDLGDLRYTIGTGFRWKIESFVRTDLFFDYGYDPRRREGKLYGGTSLAF